METVVLVTGILPIGAIITAVAQEVLKTAIAAQDVLVQQESFKALSRYLGDINGVLSDFQRRDVEDSHALRSALEGMRSRVVEAHAVIDSVKGKSRFYLLMNCRTIVKNAQVVTRAIGKALHLLMVAGAEVHMDIGANVQRLHDRMVTAQFSATAMQTHVMNELERGLLQNKTDQVFANDLLHNIAQAVGVPTEKAELRSELASFQRELEEVAVRKRDQEKAFMEQVIAILYRAEAVSFVENPDSKYMRLAQKANGAVSAYPPFPSFICPLTDQVMKDPVILGTAQEIEFTYERAAIVEWFESGNCTDPRSGTVISKPELRPNNSLRESIREWADLNDLIQIRVAREQLLAAEEQEKSEGLRSLCQFCKRSAEHKAWVVAEGVLETVADLLKFGSRVDSSDVGQLVLDTIIMLITATDSKLEIFAEPGRLLPVLQCLNTRQYRSKGAAILKELSNCPVVCGKIQEVRGAILTLVTLYFHYEKDWDVGENLRYVLEKLSAADDNVVAMAKANWCHPLIQRLSTGSDASKLCMAMYLSNTPVSNISEENKTLIAEGAPSPLVNMCKVGKIDAKMAAVGALSNLSSCARIRSHIGAAGAVPVVLELQASLMYPLELRERAAAVLGNLCSGNGIKYFIDAQKGFLPLFQAVEPYLHLQEVSSSVMRLHILRALLGMAQEKEARQLIRAGNGIPVLLSLVVASDPPSRNCSVKLLQHLSDDCEGALNIAQEVYRRKGAWDLVRLLSENVDPYAQAAVAGILTNLPLENFEKLKNSMVSVGVVSFLVKLASSSDREVQENAVGALRQFTGRSDVESQKSAANLDIHRILVQILHKGSIRSKARAAQVLRNFSFNTSRLVSEPAPPTGWNCFMGNQKPVCRVHKGRCSVKGTFCLVEAEAVAPLVSLLDATDTEAAEAGVEALETLVANSGSEEGDDDVAGEVNDMGAMVLHEVQGIRPLLHLLTHGSPLCTDKAVHLLEYILKVPQMKMIYENSARIPLVASVAVPKCSAVTRKRSIKLLADMEIGVPANP